MKSSVFLLSILISCKAFNQGEANIWYFGEHAGLDFNGGVPVPITNNVMDQFEGCSTISTSTGNLLFFTDGMTVWNQNHQAMPNGDSLAGHNSSSQSALIVPIPGDESRHYIFTADDFSESDGIRFSIVDMTLDNGLGDVVLKNQPLLQSATEKLGGIRHANGEDVWVVTHEAGNDAFYAYCVTNTGISNPVISNVGTSYYNDAKIGYLKGNVQGNRIAVVLESNLQNKIEIFDFNNATGQLSNAISLNGSPPFPYYCAEFSPSGNVLYASERSAHGHLYQYDLLAGTATDILNSEVVLNSQVSSYGALQLGPDGKMYVARYGSGYLGLINNPNILGLQCNFDNNGIYLNGGLSECGLPNFINSYFTSTQYLHINNLSSSFLVYPNPSSGTVIFQTDVPGNMQDYYLTILSSDLQVIQTENVSGKTSIVMDNTNLNSGMYFYTLKSGNTIMQTGKFIIAK